jgi:DNA polymerase III epsilon subunit-like protein
MIFYNNYQTEMKVLVVDTETTGLPEKGNPSIFSESDKWPSIIQLSFILYDTEKNKMITCQDHIIKVPNHVTITPESEKIHGISRSISQRKGVSVSQALSDFYEAFVSADMVIGHNISFDKRMIMVETVRNKELTDYNKSWVKKREYCTMKNSVNVCRIEVVNKHGEKYFKYPTLTQLHQYLFRSIPNGTHDAMADVLICLRCYEMVHEEKDICRVGCTSTRNLYRLYCA